MTLNVRLALSTQLGPHLKALRKLRKLSQQDLGKLVGVSQTRIAAIEADPGKVNFEQVMRVCRALGVELIMRTNAPETGIDQFTHRDIKPPDLAVMTTEENQRQRRLGYIARVLGVPADKLERALAKEFPNLSEEALSKVDVESLSPNQVAKLSEELNVGETVMTKLLGQAVRRLRETSGTVLERPPTKGSW